MNESAALAEQRTSPARWLTSCEFFRATSSSAVAGSPRRRIALRGRFGQRAMGTVYFGVTPDGDQVAVRMIREDLTEKSAVKGTFDRSRFTWPSSRASTRCRIWTRLHMRFQGHQT